MKTDQTKKIELSQNLMKKCFFLLIAFFFLEQVTLLAKERVLPKTELGRNTSARASETRKIRTIKQKWRRQIRLLSNNQFHKQPSKWQRIYLRQVQKLVANFEYSIQKDQKLVENFWLLESPYGTDSAVALDTKLPLLPSGTFRSVRRNNSQSPGKSSRQLRSLSRHELFTNLLLNRAFAKDDEITLGNGSGDLSAQNFCAVGGHFIKMVARRCSTRKRSCGSPVDSGIKGSQKDDQGFKCGAIFGGTCIHRTPISNLSVRCYFNSKTAKVKLVTFRSEVKKYNKFCVAGASHLKDLEPCNAIATRLNELNDSLKVDDSDTAVELLTLKTGSRDFQASLKSLELVQPHTENTAPVVHSKNSAPVVQPNSLNKPQQSADKVITSHSEAVEKCIQAFLTCKNPKRLKSDPAKKVNTHDQLVANLNPSIKLFRAWAAHEKNRFGAKGKAIFERIESIRLPSKQEWESYFKIRCKNNPGSFSHTKGLIIAICDEYWNYPTRDLLQIIGHEAGHQLTRCDNSVTPGVSAIFENSICQQGRFKTIVLESKFSDKKWNEYPFVALHNCLGKSVKAISHMQQNDPSRVVWLASLKKAFKASLKGVGCSSYPIPAYVSNPGPQINSKACLLPNDHLTEGTSDWLAFEFLERMARAQATNTYPTYLAKHLELINSINFEQSIEIGVTSNCLDNKPSHNRNFANKSGEHLSIKEKIGLIKRKKYLMQASGCVSAKELFSFKDSSCSFKGEAQVEEKNRSTPDNKNVP